MKIYGMKADGTSEKLEPFRTQTGSHYTSIILKHDSRPNDDRTLFSWLIELASTSLIPDDTPPFSVPKELAGLLGKYQTARISSGGASDTEAKNKVLNLFAQWSHEHPNAEIKSNSWPTPCGGRGPGNGTPIYEMYILYRE